MIDAVLPVIGIALAYAIGAFPLGGLIIRALTGTDPGRLNAHNLGMENSIRLIGLPTALLALLVDVLKGFLAVGLGGGGPWAVLAAYVGHVHPIAPLLLVGNPRGRGIGLLFGALASLHLFGGISTVLVSIPVIVFALILGWLGFVSFATLAGIGTLFLESLVVPGLPVAPIVILLAVSVWRHKSNLARMVDGTEVRFGTPPSVTSLDPNTVISAFMVHPMRIEDLWQSRSQAFLLRLFPKGPIGEVLVRLVLPRFRPTFVDIIDGIELPEGRKLKVLLLVGPLLPDQIREHQKVATRMVIQGARLARDLGAETFGLGGFWSTVGDKGEAVQKAVPDIAITNGGAFTAGTVKAAIPGLLKSFQEEGGALEETTAAVIGANGVVAFGIARMIAGEVGELILVGRNADRLERSAQTLATKFPQTRITTTHDINTVELASLIFTATSDPNPVLYKRHVKTGAWVFDLGRPVDVDDSVRTVQGVHIIPGGVVRPPGRMQTQVDMHFGDGLIPACLAETMIMAATRAFDKASLGPNTRTKDIEFYLKEAESLGFEIITKDENLAIASPEL